MRQFGDSTSVHLAAWALLLLLCLGIAPVSAQVAVDPGLRSPRSTVRTLLTAITVSHNDPKLIQRAISCLDLDGSPSDGQQAALLATHLEAVFRAQDIDTQLIPDHSDSPTYKFPEWNGFRMTLQRMPDGRWLFDRATVGEIPRLFAAAHKQLLERNKESAALNVSPLFASPRATVRTLLEAYRQQDQNRLQRAMDLDDIPIVARREVGTQAGNKLKQILVRQPRVILQEIPDSNYSDPFVWVAETAGIVELIRLSSGDRKGEWVFSKDTIRSIDNLFAAIEDKPFSAEIVASGTSNHLPRLTTEPELWLRRNLPQWARASLVASRYTSFEIYEVLGYVLIASMTVAVWRLSVVALHFGVRRALSRLGLPLADPIVARRIRIAGWFAGAWFLRWGLLLLGPDQAVMVPLLTVLNPAVWVLGIVSIMATIDLATDVVEAHVIPRHGVADVAQMFWPVGSLALKIALFVIMVFNLMEMFAWDVTAVLTGLGIGGLAVALGAQDVLKNLFGSLTLIADRPFLVGESVKIGGQPSGVVEAVGLRSTRIRTTDDTLLIVPNSNLTTTEIVNFGRRRYRRYATRIGVPIATSRDRMLAFRDGILELIRRHPNTRKDRFEVAVDNLAGDKIQFLIDVYFEVADRDREIDAREALILDILRLADDLKIDFAQTQDA